QHPEYADALKDVEAALAADYSVESGQSNPFLHLSMHLSIAEQISIDQPPGIRAAYQTLAQRIGEHDAHHQVMECLGEMIWASQRSGLPPDGAGYIECIRKRCLSPAPPHNKKATVSSVAFYLNGIALVS